MGLIYDVGQWIYELLEWEINVVDEVANVVEFSSSAQMMLLRWQVGDGLDWTPVAISLSTVLTDNEVGLAG